MELLHLSDLHFRKQYEDTGFQALLKKLPDPLRNLTACLESEKYRGIGLVLLTGDLCHDGTQEDYAALREALDGILNGIPWVALPGNHDDRTAMASEMPGAVDSVRYFGGLRIVTLDTGSGIAGKIGADQIVWLRSVLASPAEQGTLLALHHPLIPNQEGLGTAHVEGDLKGLIEKSDILGIFCGHTHRNYTGLFAGKPYFTADSLSNIMEEIGPDTYLKSAAAYSRISLEGGSFSIQVRQLAPAPAVAACFPTHTMSTLFQRK